MANEDITLAALGQEMIVFFAAMALPDRVHDARLSGGVCGVGSIRLLNAGHLPPLVLRADRIEELPTGSMALGMMPEATSSKRSVELADGDTLIVFSDGIDGGHKRRRGVLR